MPQPPRITVLGSLNMDISVTVPRLAGPGETVLGSAARLQPGGKGANQAVAAARLGASVRMAGCCGDDAFGGALRSALEAAGVDITAVRVLAGVPSGLALITVDATGENSITVAPGANGLAGPPEAAATAAAPCDALVLSAEIPVPVLAAALDLARAAHVMTVLNLAPAPPDASGLLKAGVDWLIVNAPEAAAILGRPVAGPAAAQAAAADLAGAGAGHVVITLGPDGAVLAGPSWPAGWPDRAPRWLCQGSACAAWTASGRETPSSPRWAWRWRRERRHPRRSGSPARSAPRP